MSLSCILHDNCIIVVYCLQGSYRLLLVLLSWCVGCCMILIYDVVLSWLQVRKLTDGKYLVKKLPDGKYLVRMMHQTLLMMYWKLSKVLEVGCILDIYPLGYLRLMDA